MEETQKTQEITEYKLEMISLDLIDLDDENPNVMTDEQQLQLSNIMKKYGNLAPVVLNGPTKAGRYKCVDGQWRVITYRKFGRKKIPAFVVNVDKADRKILQQILNKFGGTHDPTKDNQVFVYLQNQNRLEILSEYLGERIIPVELKDDESVLQDRSVDDNIMRDREETFLQGTIKQIYLFYSNEEYEKVIEKFKELMVDFGVDNHTLVVNKLIEHYENCKSR